jgi:putative ABC transport system permease protein
MKIRTCLKIAWRNLRKDGQFSVLNLAGLSIGLACTVMIYLWIADEWSVDKFNTKADGLYSAMYNIPLSDGQFFTVQSTPPPLAGALKAYPEVKDVAVIHAPDNDDGPKGVLSVNGKRIKSGELFVTPNFFDLFSFKVLAGNMQGMLGAGAIWKGMCWAMEAAAAASTGRVRSNRSNSAGSISTMALWICWG